MKRVAFTGPSSISAQNVEQVRYVVDRLDADEYMSGCAFGVDSVAALAVVESHPGKKLILAVPAAHHNVDLVKQLRSEPNVEVHQVDGNYARPGGAYMARNDFMVEWCTELQAFLRRGSFYRSGEWATVNRAEAKARRVHHNILGVQ